MRLNSGSSSRNSTPLWARLISPGVGVEPPPTRPALRDRVMRRAKRPAAKSGWPGGSRPDRAVDPRRLDRFLGRQHRQDRRHALGQHGLAGARRADHQQVVAAGGGDRDGPLGHLLAADVGEVVVVVRELLEQLVEARGRRFDVELAGEEGDRLREAVDGDHVDVFDDGRLGGVGGGDDDAAQLAAVCRFAALRGAAIAIESAPFTGRVLPSSASSPTIAYWSNSSLLNLPAAGENADGDRQIERAGTLGQFGRGQIDHDAILRPHEAAVDHRPLDAMRALLHRLLGQADEHVFGSAPGETSTSTSTGKASMPSSEKVWSLASMGSSLTNSPSE